MRAVSGLESRVRETPAPPMVRFAGKAKPTAPPAPPAYLRTPAWILERWRPTESLWDESRDQAARAYRAELLGKRDPPDWVKEIVHVKWRPLYRRTTDGRLAIYGQEPELDLLMANLGTSFMTPLPSVEELLPSSIEDAPPMLALAAPPAVHTTATPAAGPRPKPPPPPTPAPKPSAPEPPPAPPPPPASNQEESRGERAGGPASETSQEDVITMVKMLEDGPLEANNREEEEVGGTRPPAHVQMRDWIPYVDPESRHRFWWHEPSEEWFFVTGNHGWSRFCDGATGRYWWIHQSTGRFFFEQ